MPQGPDKPKMPNPAPPQPTEAEMKAQMAMLRANQAPEVAALEGAAADLEAKHVREGLGLDLDFDVDKLIMEGIVEKKGLKLMNGLRVDIHTLNKSEGLLVDDITDAILSKMDAKGDPIPVKRDELFFKTRSVTTLAMAITRCNNSVYPSPGDFRNPKVEEIKKKMALIEQLIRFPEDMIDRWIYIYVHLEIADILTGEVLEKKEGDDENQGEQAIKKAT